VAVNVTDGKRKWARITTAASAVLLLVAVISLLQVADDFVESYDPEANYLVKLGPGQTETFQINDSVVVSTLRVSVSGDSPKPELSLVDSEGNEVAGRSPGWMDPNREGTDGTIYSPVRVFEDMGGEYTLSNKGSSDLWLVDDEESAKQFSGSIWMYLFYIGCCIGSPMGVVGLVLAIMVWTDKRKLPDQFVIVEDGGVIIGNMQEEVTAHSEPESAPSPFVVDRNPIEKEAPEEVVEEYWKAWDEG
tara:strand:+ start:98 stop:838 length:741 start_codon:yes stop_codon:yes gene_type:complete